MESAQEFLVRQLIGKKNRLRGLEPEPDDVPCDRGSYLSPQRFAGSNN